MDRDKILGCYQPISNKKLLVLTYLINFLAAGLIGKNENGEIDMELVASLIEYTAQKAEEFIQKRPPEELADTLKAIKEGEELAKKLGRSITIQVR